MSRITKSRKGSIDFLKFILAIIIVFHHFQLETNTVFPFANFYYGKIMFGYVVEFFFIISGFVTMLGADNLNSDSLKHYVLRKIIRFYPMVFLSVISMVIVMIAYKVVTGVWWRDLTPSIWRIFNSITLTFQGSMIADVGMGINNPTWYLCVLMLCYIWVWILYRIAKKLGVSPYYLFFSFLVWGIGVYEFKINLPFFNMQSARGYAAFFWGVMIYYIYEKISHKKLYIISTIVCSLSFLALIYDFDVFFDNQWGIYTFVLFPAVFLLTLACDACFKSRIWNFLGNISYEMYLWHGLFIILLCLYNAVSDQQYTFSRIDMILFAVFMTGFSSIMFWFVERKITRHFINRMNSMDKSGESIEDHKGENSWKNIK